MLRSSTLAVAAVMAILATGTWCHAEQPPSLLTMIAQWQYPGSTINGATMSDAETVNARGERTVPSIQYKTVLTTKDPLDKVVQYYRAKLKPDLNAESKPGNPDAKTAADSGQSVTFHDDSEKRPLAIHIILVNTDKSSTTLVISRADGEPETHIAWTRYVRF